MEGKPSVYNYVMIYGLMYFQGGGGGEECTPLIVPQVSGLI